ncbi:MAG: hypothetical protein JWP44_3401 [Mucilaginibacter sp.]|nr:hypothetical protein [Mucilaginibacter sp.]
MGIPVFMSKRSSPLWGKNIVHDIFYKQVASIKALRTHVNLKSDCLNLPRRGYTFVANK